MHGVIDRIEDGFAVILLEEQQEELMIPQKELPDTATTGTWLQIKQTGANSYNFEIDAQKTTNQKKHVESLRKQLLKRSKRNQSY